jgi:hypothetical protein
VDEVMNFGFHIMHEIYGVVKEELRSRGLVS